MGVLRFYVNTAILVPFRFLWENKFGTGDYKGMWRLMIGKVVVKRIMAQLANEKGWIEIVIIIPALAFPHLLGRCFTFIYLSGKVCYIRVILGH